MSDFSEVAWATLSAKLRRGDSTITRAVPTPRWAGSPRLSSHADAGLGQHRRSQRSRKSLLPIDSETGTGSGTTALSQLMNR
jgi:hypothetical protein